MASKKKAPQLIKSTSKEWDNRPSISFSESQLPEIKKWNVGEKYVLEVTVEMNGIRQEDYGEEKGKYVGNFKVTSVKAEEEEEEEQE